MCFTLLSICFDFSLFIQVPGETLLFEGEQDHKIPSTSLIHLESDLFVVAGRMIGHSFLHDGPCLGGLSPAILHVLFGGSPEEATIDIKDCADLDIREKISLVRSLLLYDLLIQIGARTIQRISDVREKINIIFYNQFIQFKYW